jgi:PKD domain
MASLASLAVLAVLAVLAGLAPAAASGAHPISDPEPLAGARPIAGVVPDLPTGAHLRVGLVARTADLPYGGGPVLHSNRTHLIFWAPAGSGLAFDPGYESLIEGFLAGVAADSHKSSSVYGLTGQYRDPGGPAAYASGYTGATNASDPLPPSRCTVSPAGPPWRVCLTDSQLENEVSRVVHRDHLPAGSGDIYFLLTPNGFGSCIDSASDSCSLGGDSTGYCGYHSTTEAGLLYAVVPYNAVAGHCQSGRPRPNASTADPAISSLSHEHSETITDPEGDAWIDVSGEEDGDLCASRFGPDLGGTLASAYNEVINGGHYYLQEEWSNRDHSCQSRARPDQASFAAPPRAPVNRRVWFSASAQAGDGSIVTYDWYFGDGGTAHHRLGSHWFRRAGLYRVVLRTVDSWGNWAYYARELPVTQDQPPTGAGARATG